VWLLDVALRVARFRMKCNESINNRAMVVVAIMTATLVAKF
jgi:hypothetical protein